MGLNCNNNDLNSQVIEEAGIFIEDHLATLLVIQLRLRLQQVHDLQWQIRVFPYRGLEFRG